MTNGLGEDRDSLLERRRLAIAYARVDPQHGLFELRLILETTFRAKLRPYEPKLVERRNPPPSADEMIQAIKRHDLAPPGVLILMRFLKEVSNYGSHKQEDASFLAPGFENLWLAHLDKLLTWYLGEQAVDSAREVSGLFSLHRLEELEEQRSLTPASPERSDTDRPPAPGTPERRRAPRGPDEPRSAAEWLARAREHDGRGEMVLSVRAYQRAIHFLLKDGHVERARQCAEEVARRDPRTAAHWIQLAEMRVTEGNVPTALDAFSRAAALLREAGQDEEFVSVAERILNFDSHNVAMLRALSEVYLGNGDPERALRTFSRWLTAEPRNPAVLDSLAAAFESVGQNERAARVRQVRDDIVRGNADGTGSATPASATTAPGSISGAVSAAASVTSKHPNGWRERLRVGRGWRRVAPWLALGLAIVCSSWWAKWRTRGVPFRDASLALRGDPEHGANWVERCDFYRHSGQLDVADDVCGRALQEPSITSESRAHLLVSRALVLHAKGRDHEAAPLLADAMDLRNDTATHDAVQSVCGSVEPAPMPDEVGRVLVVASSSMPLTVFANRGGKTKRYSLTQTECVAITPPVRGEDGSVWVRIARDFVPDVVSVEMDMRYGYVPVIALRPASTATDREDCATLTRAGLPGRARIPCERAAFASDPSDALEAALAVSRAWLRLGTPKRALPWIAAALQLDGGKHSDDVLAQLQEACRESLADARSDGREFQIVDWPWDDRAASLAVQTSAPKGRLALPTGTCVLTDAASLNTTPDNVLVEAVLDGQAVRGLVNRSLLKP